MSSAITLVNRPFYKGEELWKLLPIEIGTSESLFQFGSSLNKKYKTYVDTTSEMIT